jgi:hypothetical protein
VAHDDATVHILVGAPPPIEASALHVVVWCGPDRSVAALAQQGIGAAHATALWNRAVRGAATALAGRPVVVVDGEALARGGDDRRRALAPLLQGLGVGAGDEAGAPAPTLPRSGTGGVTAAELGVTPPPSGWHDRWAPPASEPAPPWCEELLSAAWRTHRALLEAREAWLTLDEQRRTAPAEDPAVAAVRERDVRRLEDLVIGREAEIERLRAQLDAGTADRVVAERRARELTSRVAALEAQLAAAQDELARMAASWPWRIGRAVTAPARGARRVLGPADRSTT